MIAKTIAWSLRNGLIVVAAGVLLLILGAWQAWRIIEVVAGPRAKCYLDADQPRNDQRRP